MFQDKVIVITGGAGGIGKSIREEFEKEGASVCIIDTAENPYFVGDVGEEAVLRRFAEKVITEYGRVDCLINNAPPLFKGISECTYEEFNYALRVGGCRFSADAAISALVCPRLQHRQYFLHP